jgi:hypothetical protein
VPAAAKPTDPCSSKRRFKRAMVVSFFPVRTAYLTLTLYFCFDDWGARLGGLALPAGLNTQQQ